MQSKLDQYNKKLTSLKIELTNICGHTTKIDTDLSNYFFREEIEKIIKYHIIPTINDYTDYLLFKENNIKSHLEIDIGMNRFGIKNNYLAIINDNIITDIYIHLYNTNIDKNIRFIEELGKKYNKNIHIGGSVAYGKTKATIRIGRLLYDNAISMHGEIVNIKNTSKTD